MTRPFPALFLLLGLAACATPQERCLNTATRDLRTVNMLIDQTQGNIARGFAVESRTDWVTDFDWCPGPYWGRGYYRPMMCERDVPVTTNVPRAIDLRAEQAKLDGLLEKRSELTVQTGARVDACRAAYPSQ